MSQPVEQCADRSFHCIRIVAALPVEQTARHQSFDVSRANFDLVNPEPTLPTVAPSSGSGSTGAMPATTGEVRYDIVVVNSFLSSHAANALQLTRTQCYHSIHFTLLLHRV